MAVYRYFMHECSRIVSNVVRTLTDSEANVDVFEREHSRLTAVYRNACRVSTVFPPCNAVCEELRVMLHDIDVQKQHLQPRIALQARRANGIGRPRYIITREQLTYYAEIGFSTKEMADLLHVSRSVVKRQLRQYGISLTARFSNITDQELDVKVKAITENNPHLGQRVVQGSLASEGIIVQRQRVADSLLRTDEAAVALRWCRTIQRRIYKVSRPNALWHIDGNHKLIRWNFVIHGGIDGFSRLVIFMSVAGNNRSETMMDAFVTGVGRFGVPSRVRSDHGLENTGVATFMLGYRGVGRGSIITGKSVHNQRIERLWRDLFASCTGVFHRLFCYLEESGHLDISNDLHMWCLHYVYLPRIQRSLHTFLEAWNHHSMRSEHGHSPTQLFVQGILQTASQGDSGVDDLLLGPAGDDVTDNIQQYGIDEDGPVPDVEEPTQILANRFQCPVTEERLLLLKATVDPLRSTDLGEDIYLEVVRFCEDDNIQ